MTQSSSTSSDDAIVVGSQLGGEVEFSSAIGNVAVGEAKMFEVF